MKYILTIILLFAAGFVLLLLFNQPRIEEAQAYQEMALALQQQALVAQEAVAVTGRALQVTEQAVRGLVWVSVGLLLSQLLLLLVPRLPRRRPRRRPHQPLVAHRPGLPPSQSPQPFNWRQWEHHPWDGQPGESPRRLKGRQHENIF